MGLRALPGLAKAVSMLVSTSLLTPKTSSQDLAEMAGRILSARLVAIPLAQQVAMVRASGFRSAATGVAMARALSIPSVPALREIRSDPLREGLT